MRKDPTEFRQRFAAWKNGEQVYKAGLPKYKMGTLGDTDEQQAVQEWGQNWKTRLQFQQKPRPQIKVQNSANGGYSSEQLAKNKKVHGDWDPTSGADVLGYIGNAIARSLNGHANEASGEEDQYWRAYLGLKNKVPAMNPKDATPWDSIVEARNVQNNVPTSDFYGGTDRMKYFTEAIADTLNTGRLVRKGVSAYKGIYNAGKRILQRPYKYHTVNGDDVEDAFDVLNGDNGRNEWNPLGMNKSFAIMWDPKEQRLYAHDTYDFPKYVHKFTNIPVRPKEMKIRYSIPFSPYIGSEYFNLRGINIPASLVEPFVPQNKYRQ